MTEPRSLTLKLPWPPSTNKIWRAVGGRIVLSKAARDYAVKVQNALPTGRAEPLRGRLHVTMRLYPPTKLKQASDIANREKCLFDCLTKQRVWLDDSQIDELIMMRAAPAGEGHAWLYIEEIDNPPNES